MVAWIQLGGGLGSLWISWCGAWVQLGGGLGSLWILLLGEPGSSCVGVLDSSGSSWVGVLGPLGSCWVGVLGPSRSLRMVGPGPVAWWSWIPLDPFFVVGPALSGFIGVVGPAPVGWASWIPQDPLAWWVQIPWGGGSWFFWIPLHGVPLGPHQILPGGGSGSFWISLRRGPWVPWIPSQWPQIPLDPFNSSPGSPGASGCPHSSPRALCHGTGGAEAAAGTVPHITVCCVANPHSRELAKQEVLRLVPIFLGLVCVFLLLNICLPRLPARGQSWGGCGVHLRPGGELGQPLENWNGGGSLTAWLIAGTCWAVVLLLQRGCNLWGWDLGPLLLYSRNLTCEDLCSHNIFYINSHYLRAVFLHHWKVTLESKLALLHIVSREECQAFSFASLSQSLWLFHTEDAFLILATSPSAERNMTKPKGPKDLPATPVLPAGENHFFRCFTQHWLTVVEQSVCQPFLCWVLGGVSSYLRFCSSEGSNQNKTYVDQPHNSVFSIYWLQYFNILYF